MTVKGKPVPSRDADNLKAVIRRGAYLLWMILHYKGQASSVEDAADDFSDSLIKFLED